jgi:hypothetical protein
VSSHSLARFGCSHPSPLVRQDASIQSSKPSRSAHAFNPKGIASPPGTAHAFQSLYFFHVVKEQPTSTIRNQKSEDRACKTAPRAPFTDFCLLASDPCSGGADRDRTDDPLLAKQVLSQLSYSPASALKLSSRTWWVWVDLNHRPHAYQACALTN